MRIYRSSFICLLGAVALVAPGQAQFQDLARLIPELFDETVVLFEAGHEAHFVDSSAVLRDAGIQINSSIVSQISTYPVSSSAGGFTYEFNEELGVFERSTEGFGPVFTERGSTIGNGKWNFGASFFSTEYDSIDNLSLREGDLLFSLTHLDTNNDGTTVESFFEGDLILGEAAITLKTDTFVVFGTFGVTDRFDLAVAVPLVGVDLDAQLVKTINRQATEGRDDPPLHRFQDGSSIEVTRASGTASGVGDILVRGKVNLASSESADGAMAVDVRLPSGDEENLLGSGATQTKVYFIGSAAFNKVSSHFNVGYTFTSGGSSTVGELADEVNFNAALDAALSPKVTVSVEGVWRTLLDATQIQRRDDPFLFRRFDSTVIQTTTRPLIEARTEDLNLLIGAFGIKINLGGTMLLTANLAMSMGNDGLQDEDVVGLIGLDYSF